MSGSGDDSKFEIALRWAERLLAGEVTEEELDLLGSDLSYLLRALYDHESEE